MNSTFLNLFDANIQAKIKQIKIPYRPGSGTSQTINSGANGLSAKIFLLSDREVGYTQSNVNRYIGGVFLAVANETNFRKDIVATVKSNFGKHLPVMDAVIPATVRLAEVSTADKSIFQHEPRGRAAEAYRSLTKEVLKIGEKQRSRTSDLSR